MADPQIIIQKVKSVCFSGSSSLGAPIPGADACLDAFEEAFSLHLLESQRTTSPESTVPAWSRACREGCSGLLER